MVVGRNFAEAARNHKRERQRQHVSQHVEPSPAAVAEAVSQEIHLEMGALAVGDVPQQEENPDETRSG